VVGREGRGEGGRDQRSVAEHTATADGTRVSGSEAGVGAGVVGSSPGTITAT